MGNDLSTFSIEDAFRITGHGWVLAGSLDGQAQPGNRLLFTDGLVLTVTAINVINTLTQASKAGLLISNQFASRQELIDKQIIGASAQVLE